MNPVSVTESPAVLYSNLINRLVNTLCEQIAIFAAQGTQLSFTLADTKKTNSWLKKILRICKYMRMIEKTATDPLDIGLHCYY